MSRFDYTQIMLSATVEDYLKRIYLLHEYDSRGRVSTGKLAATLELTPGSVTAMLKGLAAEGLVDHAPYAGVRLTARGSKLAREIVRRHRLLELFLVNIVGLGWSEVHAEAERLEHAVSDRLLERIDELLGRPERDPHGHPIPRLGTAAATAQPTLLDCPLETPLRVIQVPDEDPDFLKRLAELGLTPGRPLWVLMRDEAAETVSLRLLSRQRVELGFGAAGKVRVIPVRGA
jgi:DtxR family Mn-dependent transcriptional regulator